jgi:translocation and assembly module TamB
MTFAVGGPVLEVTDVDLRAAPVNFDLLRTLAGGPFPYDFQGDLTGRCAGPAARSPASGWPTRRWPFADAHVPGAVSRVRGRGGLDILRPAETKFRDFAVEAERVDLRTVQYVNPLFPRLGGVVRGRARLDSSYLDVRFRDAVLTHADGPAAPTTVAGAGRVTFGSKVTTYDLALDARPLSFTTLARSYPALPARGTFAGPIRVRGATDDLELVTRLTGAAGALAFDGRVNARGPVYAARGRFAAEALDPRLLTGSAALPPAALTLRGTADLRLSSLADAAGSVAVDLGRSTLAGSVLDAGVLRARAERGRLVFDTLDVAGAAGRLRAAGALGLTARAAGDTLRVDARVDSLGGLRRWLAAGAAAPAPAPPGERAADPVARAVARAAAQPVAVAVGRALARAAADTGAPPPAAAAAAAAPPDSLAGTLQASVILAGTLDTTRASAGLSADVTVAGRDLVYGRLGARALDLRASVADARRAPAAAVSAGGDSLRLGGVTFARADGTFAGAAGGGRFAVRAGSAAGALLSGGGVAARTADSTTVTLDSLRLAPRPGRAWTLEAPARLTARVADNVLAVDSLALRGADGSRMAAAGALRDRGPVAGSVALDGVSLADLGAALGALGLAPALAPRPAAGDAAPGAPPADSLAPVDGRLTARLALGGTRAAPTLDLRLDAADVRGAGARVDRVTGAAAYAAGRLAADVGVLQRGRRVLDARGDLPLDLALVPVADRLGTAPVRATVRADSLDVALLAAAVPRVRDARGRVEGAMDLSGTWRKPRLDGRVQLAGGGFTSDAAGIRVEDAAADVALAGDSVTVRRLVARSGGPGDTLAVTGTVRLAELGNPTLDLRLAARNVLAVDRPRLATLWVSTPEPLAVTGTYRAAAVRGALRAERGRVYIPELIDKRVVDLSEYIDVVDTTLFRNRRLLPEAPAAFVENLALSGVRLSVGNDVWLRSPETNIKLGGSLAVTRAVTRAGGRARADLALLGALNVERGTYRLDLLRWRSPPSTCSPGPSGSTARPTSTRRSTCARCTPSGRTGRGPTARTCACRSRSAARWSSPRSSSPAPTTRPSPTRTSSATSSPASRRRRSSGRRRRATSWRPRRASSRGWRGAWSAARCPPGAARSTWCRWRPARCRPTTPRPRATRTPSPASSAARGWASAAGSGPGPSTRSAPASAASRATRTRPRACSTTSRAGWACGWSSA